MQKLKFFRNFAQEAYVQTKLFAVCNLRYLGKPFVKYYVCGIIQAKPISLSIHDFIQSDDLVLVGQMIHSSQSHLTARLTNHSAHAYIKAPVSFLHYAIAWVLLPFQVNSSGRNFSALPLAPSFLQFSRLASLEKTLIFLSKGFEKEYHVFQPVHRKYFRVVSECVRESSGCSFIRSLCSVLNSFFDLLIHRTQENLTKAKAKSLKRF